MKVKLVITLLMIAVISFGCGKAETVTQETEKMSVEEETEIQEDIIEEESVEVETVESETMEDKTVEPETTEDETVETKIEEAVEEISEEVTEEQEEKTVKEEGRVVELSRSEVLFSEEIGQEDVSWVDQIPSSAEYQHLIQIMKKIPKEEFENAVSIDEIDTLSGEGGIVTFLKDEKNDLYVYGYSSIDHYLQGVIIKYRGAWSYFHSQWDRKGFTEFHVGDFDQDGSREIAQISPGGQGTGLFVERLVIFEDQGDGTLKSNQFLYAHQTDQIFEKVKFYKDTIHDQFIVKAPNDGEVLIPWEEENVYNNEVFLDIEEIRKFDIEGDKISYIIKCGVYSGGIPRWTEECGIHFSVKYNNGQFSLR